jgi:hypothetical protein
MDRSRFPEKYKTLTIVIPPDPDPDVEKKEVCPAPKHLLWCMTNCVPHCK